MASVAWTKLHSAGEVKGVLRHDCKDTRQAAATHSNEDIQRDMTKQNTGVLDGYADTARAYDERMAELPPPRRKDAVVGLGFSAPMPDGLPADKEDEWAERVYRLMADQYGEKNIVCFVVHRDERHEYIDPDTKEKTMSRTHIQGVLVPESEGRLCAKEVTGRANMQRINQAINDMTQRDYGLDYMTGEKSKSRGSVETLKQRSRRAELEQMNEKLEAKNAELEKMTDGPIPKAVYRKAKQRKEDAQKQAEEAKAEQQEAEAKRDEAERQAEEAQQRASEARQQVEASHDTLKAMKAEAGAIRRTVADTVGKAEEIRDYMQRMATGKLPPGDGAVLAYLKANKAPDGKSLYTVYTEKAAAATRRVATKQYQDLDSVIADAQRRAQKLPDISHIKQRGDSYDGPEF